MSKCLLICDLACRSSDRPSRKALARWITGLVPDGATPTAPGSSCAASAPPGRAPVAVRHHRRVPPPGDGHRATDCCTCGPADPFSPPHPVPHRRALALGRSPGRRLHSPRRATKTALLNNTSSTRRTGGTRPLCRVVAMPITERRARKGQQLGGTALINS